MSWRAGYRIGYSALFSNPTPQLLAMKLDETEKGKEKPDELLPSKRLEENVSVAYGTNWVRHPLGDVLLTGATGFLGSHVLKELLLRNGGRIYCLVRRSEKLTGWERLQEVMRFYFGTALDAHLRRIQVIEGDFLTAPLPPTKTPLTVINCAALVKHFAAVEDLQKNNVEGPLRLADYCMKKGHRLVQRASEIGRLLYEEGTSVGADINIAHRRGECLCPFKNGCRRAVAGFNDKRALPENCAIG